MAKRQLDDWLSSYLEYVDNSESPTSYHTWAGLSCIASALQRKVYMKWGHSTIYPNMYIILIGPSGHGRKGEPVDIIRWILEELNVSVVEEDITEEALIQELKRAEISFLDEETSSFKWQSAVTACAEELSVFLGERNTRLHAYLTNWYDSRDKWSRRTKLSTTEEIVGMCFNLLSSTAPDWLPYILSKESIGGGFTSRCIFVVEEGKRKTVADPNKNMADPALREALIYDLEMINSINGRYRFEPDAQAAYEFWYEGEDDKVRKGQSILPDPSLQGYESRRPTHVKKIAMCLCASYKDDLSITLDDFEKAKALMLTTEKNMPKAFAGMGTAKNIESTERIIEYIKHRKSVKHSELMRVFYRNVDDAAAESIMTVLRQMKIVRMSILSDEDDRRYTYIGETEGNEKEQSSGGN
jgi:hypothetical protein